MTWLITPIPLLLLLELKVTPTVVSASIVMLQAPFPVQAPVHPANEEPVPAASVSVTTVPPLKLAAQDVPQLTPAGLLVTVPDPLPEG